MHAAGYLTYLGLSCSNNEKILLRLRNYKTTESVIVAYTHKYAKFWVCIYSLKCTGIRYLLYYKSNIRAVCLRWNLEIQLFTKVESSRFSCIPCQYFPIYMTKLSIRIRGY